MTLFEVVLPAVDPLPETVIARRRDRGDAQAIADEHNRRVEPQYAAFIREVGR